MKKAEVVLLPSPGAGHLMPAVDIAKILLERDEQLSITVIIMKLPMEIGSNSYINFLSATATPRLQFVDLPNDDLASDPMSKSPHVFLSESIESHKAHVRDVVAKISFQSSSSRLAGFIVDMFCNSMIDVANEFGVPTYLFFTSSAAFLGLIFHLQTLTDDFHKDITEFNDPETELHVPSFSNPVPAKVLPFAVLDKTGGSNMVMAHARRFRETKGILVNTFMELESYAIQSHSKSNGPVIYPVGPILKLFHDDDDRSIQSEKNIIMKWLDNQPPSSVVFLCFGSMGSFNAEQVKEIAEALERCGHRFLWSLRRPPSKGKVGIPSDYENPEEALPQGFLERTAGIGKVIGWAPQTAVLYHPAVGGFVSHCGWNSTLESVWCGVPMATWPLYAEQQINAFSMVVEKGMAVEIKMDYKNDFGTKMPEILSADVIESGIRRLMIDGESSKIREKVKDMKEKSRMAMEKGGSSYAALGRFIEDVVNNIS